MIIQTLRFGFDDANHGWWWGGTGEGDGSADHPRRSGEEGDGRMVVRGQGGGSKRNRGSGEVGDGAIRLGSEGLKEGG